MHALRVLDDDDTESSSGRLMLQEAFREPAAVRLVIGSQLNPKLTEQFEQEVARRDALATHRSNDDAIVEVANEARDQQALAAALLRNDDAKPGPGPQRVAHEFEGAQVLIAREKSRVVFAGPEWIAAQAEWREQRRRGGGSD